MTEEECREDGPITVERLTTVLYDWMPDGAGVSVGIEGKSRHLTGSDLAQYIFERAAEYPNLPPPAALPISEEASPWREMTPEQWDAASSAFREDQRRQFERLAPKATARCATCGHYRLNHSRGGMCDGDGSECYCVQFPDAPDFYVRPGIEGSVT